MKLILFKEAFVNIPAFIIQMLELSLFAQSELSIKLFSFGENVIYIKLTSDAKLQPIKKNIILWFLSSILLTLYSLIFIIALVQTFLLHLQINKMK